MQTVAEWRDAGDDRAERQQSALDHPVLQCLFYAIIATIPYFRWRQLPGPEFLKLDWLLMGALLVLMIPALITHKVPPARLKSNLWGPLALFLVVNAVASLLSPFPGQASAGMMTLGQTVVFLIVIVLMVNPRGFESAMPWTIGLSMAIGALLSSLGYFFGVETFSTGLGEGTRGAGPTIGANNMALMCVFALPLLVHWTVFGHSRVRRGLGFLFALSVILGVFSTVSRGGFVNLLMVTALLALQYRNHFQIRYLGLLVAGLAIVATGVVLFIPQDYFARQATIITQAPFVSEGGGDQSLDRRADYVKVGLRAFADKPLLGWGANCFQSYWRDSLETRKYDMTPRPAHNTYIEVLVATGLIGTAIFAMLLLRALMNYRGAEQMLRAYGDESGAQLIAAYRIGLTAVLVYFLMKSGLEHKYFLLGLALSHGATIFAHERVAAVLQREGRASA